MSFFLVTYAKADSAEPAIRRFEDADEAMREFVAAERLHRRLDDGRAAVLLIADDEQTLRTTHSHYFSSPRELLDAVAQ
jgi:hypothetical protein